jgi:hypothetical protein
MMIIMRRAALLIVVVALVSPAIFATADPAGACSCIAVTDQQAFGDADAVFTGRLVDVRQPKEVHTSLDPATWVFAVDHVYKGAVRKRQEIVTAILGASCGLETMGPGRLVVFARGYDGVGVGPHPAKGQYAASLCGGTRLLADRGVPATFGRGHPPKKR